MPLPNPSMDFSAFDVLPAGSLDDMVENIESLSDGTGIDNLEIGSGHTSVKNDYKFSVYRNAALTPTSGALTLLPFDAKLFDTGSNVDVVTNKGRFTAPVAGFYHFDAGFSQNTDIIEATLYKNGALALNGITIHTSVQNLSTTVSGILQLSANDYVEVYYFVDGTNPIITGSPNCYYHGFLISQT